MSTEAEKAKNRAKQARFQERHPDYFRKQQARARIKPTVAACRATSFRLFELADPRDQDKLPRLIGYCRRAVTPVWANFWLAKDHSKACWASWLRELASLGLEPVELKTGMLGIAVGLSESLAKSLVTLRLRQMNEVVMRNAVIAPPWSLRNILAYKDCHSPLPVGCLCPEGTFHFSSEGEAHKITGVPSLSVLVARVDFDKHGCLWFED